MHRLRHFLAASIKHLALATTSALVPIAQAEDVSPAEVRAVAKEAYTPQDKAFQTPNSDTPYSFLGADLRAKPLVLTVPEFSKDRYYSIQFIDTYTFNFAYAGSRTTGKEAGSIMLAGPNWKGAKPQGIKELIQSETEINVLIYRTQLFDPSDLDNVKKIQSQYQVQPLSQFLGKSAPAPAPAIDFIKPISQEEQKSSLEGFNILNFILQFLEGKWTAPKLEMVK